MQIQMKMHNKIQIIICPNLDTVMHLCQCSLSLQFNELEVGASWIWGGVCTVQCSMHCVIEVCSVVQCSAV